jgi:hypothetical protein
MTSYELIEGALSTPCNRAHLEKAVRENAADLERWKRKNKERREAIEERTK